MASTAPAKSQPLHNFDLPHLKWNKDGSSTSNHQRRRSVTSPSRRPNLSPLRNSPYRQSPLRDSPPPPSDCSVKQSPIRGESSSKWQSPIPIRRDSESETSGRSKGSVIVHRKNQSKKNQDFDGLRSGEVNSSNSELGTDKPLKKLKASEVDAAGIKRSSKIKIKIPSKSKPEEENQQDDAVRVDRGDEGDEAEEVQEEGKNNNNIGVDEEAKTWNLRPRKPMCKSVAIGGGGLKNSLATVPESSRNLTNKTGENEGNGGEKEKKKLSINISLTKEEIEEDFFGWTGAKPPRRAKKRPKNVQKQLDFVFPGLWLVSITPDTYKVSENYMKG